MLNYFLWRSLLAYGSLKVPYFQSCLLHPKLQTRALAAILICTCMTLTTPIHYKVLAKDGPCRPRKHLITRSRTSARPEDGFLSPFAPRREMAYPVPTKAFLQPSSDTVMLFASFGCTHPPPPGLPFLLTENLSPNGIARSDFRS